MNSNAEELRKIIDAVSPDLPVEHPPAETLTAYAEEMLPPQECEQIQEHLIWCVACTDLVIDLKSFPDVPNRHDVTPPPPAAFLDNQPETVDSEHDQPTEQNNKGRVLFLWRLSTAYSLAACFLISTILTTSLWLAEKNDPVETDFQELILRPELNTRGSVSPPKSTTLESRRVLIKLQTQYLSNHLNYSATLLDDRNKVLWTGTLDSRDARNAFILNFDGRLFSAGRYTIMIHETGRYWLPSLEEYNFGISGD